MYLQSLTIYRNGKEIRPTIYFHKGLNFVVDASNTEGGSGNGVGKTTFLRLIDYCLGMKLENVYTSNNGTIDQRFREHLENFTIKVQLCIVDDLDNPDPAKTIVIDRTLTREFNFTRILCGGKELKPNTKELDLTLRKLLFPKIKTTKPTLRQLSSHNMRHSHKMLSSIIQIQDGAPQTSIDKEILMLALLGCDVENAELINKKNEQIKKLDEEQKEILAQHNFQNRHELASDITWKNAELEDLQQCKATLNVNYDLSADVEKLNTIRHRLSDHISRQSNLVARKNILRDTLESYKDQLCDEDTETLQEIYKQAGYLNEQLAKTFKQLTAYHNSMMRQRKKFVEPSLEEVEASIATEQQAINQLHNEEIQLSEKISRADTFDEMLDIMEQIRDMQQTLQSYNASLTKYDANHDERHTLSRDIKNKRKSQYGYAYIQKVRKQLRELNNLHKTIAEQFKQGNNSSSNGFTYSQIQLNNNTDIDQKKQYEFTATGDVPGEGYKLADIACFDVAYAKYAEQQGLDYLHFLLYDQFEKLDKALMPNLLKILTDSNQQCIMAILKQDIPEELCTPENIILELSQEERLMLMEKAENEAAMFKS